MSLDIDRRTFSKGALLISISGIAAACRPLLPPPPPLVVAGDIVDIHCHLFNGQDLPVVRFITKVVIPENETPEPRIAASRAVEDPSVLELVLQWFKDRLLHETPTAEQEIAYLKGEASLRSNATAAGAPDFAVSTLADVIQGRPPDGVGPRLAPDARSERFRTLLLDAAAQSGTMSLNRAAPRAEPDPREAALAAYESQSTIGVYLRWFTLFMQYRHSLAEQLTSALTNDGRKPVLLVPLMIDYSKWLGESVASSLRDQVEVFDLIARGRQASPAIHGMVAYDPLRAVYHQRRPDLQAEDPLSIVEDALESHGFLGVKLYPPMGFRAAGNTDGQGYPDLVAEELRGVAGLGRDLDDALDRLYGLCTRIEAPVIAHAAATQGAGRGYADRADPTYWLRVLKRWPGLRLCLAHQGRFGYRSLAPETAGQIYEDIIGRHISENPDTHLCMDISYLSEALRPGAENRKYYADSLKAWIGRYDRNAEHILFGTDWIMVGIEKAGAAYTRNVIWFLTEDCGLSADQLDRILRLNAGRYLGLRDGDATRRRLLEGFYSVNQMPETLLPPFA
ncbi:putative TIM-barrel fold metal-dependent hydrolase [Inquilinus ginsengisoli]|uniref:TIM-barrel fold metal-dependent hydrolase n=1 Tax=Inquilinus ginsengisoli TaxID=363840 RepID=A0ABU1JGN3_9PROT|nr:amidohydrolase family protein [Inquilinus ginsengisoli]MDR6287782.1 putative TIM-barrel fold metal-dependent hydrolase [Inquilinus ginsengisoli]